MANVKDYYNTIHNLDNLDFMRSLPDACIDLCIIDPPFGSNRNYNMVKEGNLHSERSFEDTWALTPEVREEGMNWTDNSSDLQEYRTFRLWLKGIREAKELDNPSMLAYIYFLAPRLVQKHRILKPNGNLLVHCDPYASPQIREMLNMIFGSKRFRNEITWMRTYSHNNVSRNVGNIKDYIIVFSKTQSSTFNVEYSPISMSSFSDHYTEGPDGRWYSLEQLTSPRTEGSPSGSVTGTELPWRDYDPGNCRWKQPKVLWDEYYARTGKYPEGNTIQEKYEALDKEGLVHHQKGKVPRYKHYAVIQNGKIRGKPTQNIIGLTPGEIPDFPQCELWADIKLVNSQSKEKVNFEGQKPIALYERLIRIYSNPGEVVLDTFMGSGTTAIAAKNTHRDWIGVEKMVENVNLANFRYASLFKVDCVRNGTKHPFTPEEAEALAKSSNEGNDDVEKWITTHIFRGNWTGRPGDGGRDGWVPTTGWSNGVDRSAIIQVKCGEVTQEDLKTIKHADDLLAKFSSEFLYWVIFRKYCTSPLKKRITDINMKLNRERGPLRTGHPGDTRVFQRVQLLFIESHFEGLAYLGAQAPSFPSNIGHIQKLKEEMQEEIDAEELWYSAPSE